jgi:hypothetical protein
VVLAEVTVDVADQHQHGERPAGQIVVSALRIRTGMVSTVPAIVCRVGEPVSVIRPI